MVLRSGFTLQLLNFLSIDTFLRHFVNDIFIHYVVFFGHFLGQVFQNYDLIFYGLNCLVSHFWHLTTTLGHLNSHVIDILGCTLETRGISRTALVYFRVDYFLSFIKLLLHFPCCILILLVNFFLMFTKLCHIAT